MAENNNKIKKKSQVSEEFFRKVIELQKIGNRAVKKAQEENRKLGIPNWYEIGGVIISDQEIAQKKNSDK